MPGPQVQFVVVEVYNLNRTDASHEPPEITAISIWRVTENCIYGFNACSQPTDTEQHSKEHKATATLRSASDEICLTIVRQ
jgi:hypothetical protein